MPADKCRRGVEVRMYLMYAILRLHKAHAKINIPCEERFLIIVINCA